MPINGYPFVASGLTLNSALSVDLFIPNNQPNQNYLGALQMYLTCPSVNAFNEYIGQVELTGKPQNAYSTLVAATYLGMIPAAHIRAAGDQMAFNRGLFDPRAGDQVARGCHAADRVHRPACATR